MIIRILATYHRLVIALGTAIVLSLGAPAVGGAQQMADSYRNAAKAYREAADKAAAPQRACYLTWARYYDGYAASLATGGPPAPSRPSLDEYCRGGAAGSGATTGTSAATAGAVGSATPANGSRSDVDLNSPLGITKALTDAAAQAAAANPSKGTNIVAGAAGVGLAMDLLRGGSAKKQKEQADARERAKRDEEDRRDSVERAERDRSTHQRLQEIDAERVAASRRTAESDSAERARKQAEANRSKESDVSGPTMEETADWISGTLPQLVEQRSSWVTATADGFAMSMLTASRISSARLQSCVFNYTLVLETGPSSVAPDEPAKKDSAQGAVNMWEVEPSGITVREVGSDNEEFQILGLPRVDIGGGGTVFKPHKFLVVLPSRTSETTDSTGTTSKKMPATLELNSAAKAASVANTMLRAARLCAEQKKKEMF